MTTYTWANPVSGDWNTGTLWTPGVVPNIGTLAPAPVDVVIDATATGTPYIVTIGTAESFTINSLTLNDTLAASTGANANPYDAAEITIDGTLAFAAGSAGILGNSAAGGSLQTYIFTDLGDNASIVNAGTIDGFIQAEGNLTLTGTNAVYITNDIQALGGTVTIDTPIAEITGTTLFDGIFQAVGPGAATVDLGGAGNLVDITTIEGPPLNLAGWTELTFNGPDTEINEWTAAGYVSVETTLTEIRAGGTVDVLTGRDYTTTKTLTVDNLGGSTSGGGLLNLQAGTVTTGGLVITGGVVQGAATIVGSVTNNGTLIAEGGTLTLTGALSGTGVVDFDFDTEKDAAVTGGATLAVGSVTAGQTFTMNGDDTLVLNAPASFAGTVAAKVGDTITLTGATVTSATISGESLIVLDGTTTVATIALSGSYANEHVTVAGSTLTFATGTVLPPPANVAYDFNGDGVSDILYQDADTGDLGYSAQPAAAWSDYGAPAAGYSVVGIGDFNGNGPADILFTNTTTGDTGYLANPVGGGAGTWVDLGASSTAYSIVGTGDFTGNGTDDLLFRDSTSGDMGIYLLSASGPNTWQDLGSPSLLYSVVGVGDFTGSGKAGILFENTATGDMGYYQPAEGGSPGSWTGLGAASTDYSVVGIGDFNGDGTSDILFRDNATGDTGYLAMPKGGGQATWTHLGISSTDYAVVGVGDFTGKGVSDILFRDNATGDTGYLAPQSGSTPAAWHDLGASSTAYQVVASPTFG